MSASAAKGDVTVPLLELEYVRKDGSTFWGELHVNFLKDASGKLTGMQGVLRDISERRQSEKEFWALSLRNETILSSVPDIIMQVNDDKVYTWANPAGMEFFGPDVIGKEASYYFEGEQKTYEIVQPLFNGSDDVFYLESWQRRKDGIKRLLAWWCRALKDENGRVAGVLSTARDITEKERINAELQNAEKLKSIGALAGGIAHDFNNLLTGIFGYIQMASLNLPENSQAARDLKNATDVFSRAKSLTQQLLTFSKGGTPVKKNVSISIIIQETARFALSGSNVSAETDIPDDLWTCEADENQITQVIDNILINARQAMPLGGTIRMCASNVSRGAELTPLLSDKPYVKISIRDQGIGIQKEILPRIFDPFFTTKQQGSGLGLAMAYSIVKKHNGLIGVDSEPGKGTVFTIYLPASQWPIVKATPANVYSGKMGHRRVLFMDDEESICVAASVFLREIGCLVTIASGGRHAVELFKKARLDGAPFDLIILDLTIPGGMGGKQALEEIREIDASVNAVASSGYSDDPVMAEPEKFGFKAKIDKPYMKDDLQELVGNFPF
jgi:PAS domain S-box-containing protein